ncbi:hypothetical protein [Streptomyces sp. NPDC054838]
MYTAQQQLELVANQPIPEQAHLATLSVLDFYDVVVAGHASASGEFIQAWRAVRRARAALIEEMRKALRRT